LGALSVVRCALRIVLCAACRLPLAACPKSIIFENQNQQS